jgi:hypothetical protein
MTVAWREGLQRAYGRVAEGVNPMLAVLLIGGIGFLLAGLLAVGFGIPVKEFSFGNTLILTGAMIACTGVMMLAIWTAVRELKKLGGQLAAGIAAGSDAPNLPGSADFNPVGIDPREDGGVLFGRDSSAATAGNAERDAQSEAQSRWPDEPALRDRSNGPNQEPVDANPPAKPRRNLLFSSTSRKERERAQGRTTETSVGEFSSGNPLASPLAPMGEDSTETPSAQSEDAWAKPARERSSEPPQRRSGRAPSSSRPAGRTEDQPVTVLKAGVVDGMAYSLYSDGSIEAQMPEGMMRFASIDELRAHLDQRP